MCRLVLLIKFGTFSAIFQVLFLMSLLSPSLSSFFWTYSSVALETFSFFSELEKLIIMCIGVIFFIFFVLGICCASWTCGYIVFVKLGKCSDIIHLNISVLTLSSLSMTLIMFMFLRLTPAYSSLMFFPLLFFTLFFSLCSLFWVVLFLSPQLQCQVHFMFFFYFLV